MKLYLSKNIVLVVRLSFTIGMYSYIASTQDLLQLQYEGLAVMKMFGRAKINVNLLIYLINKKFYGIQK